MSKSKEHSKPKIARSGKKPQKTGYPYVKSSLGKIIRPTGQSIPGKQAASTRPRKHQQPRVPDDPQEFSDIPGVPTRAEIEAGAGTLSPEDQKAFAELRTELARHLGSHAAARVWLKSQVPGLDGTPLDAVRAGHVRQLLAVQKQQWGDNPPHA